MKTKNTRNALVLGSISLSLTPTAYAACVSAGAPPTYTCSGVTANLVAPAPGSNGATLNLDPGATLQNFTFAEAGQTAYTGNPDLGPPNVTINTGAGSSLGVPTADSGI